MMRFRGHLRARFWAAVLSLLVVSSACARADGTIPDGGGAGGPGPGSYADDEAVLRVEHIGGFVPVDFLVTRLPIVSVFGDGRVITEGPVLAIYPGPALPNVQVALISKADVDRLVARAVAAGVGRGLDLGEPPITDVPSTRFTVLTGAGAKVTEVYALGEAGGLDSGLSAAQREARAELRDLLAALTDLPTTLGAGAASQSEPYVPTSLAVAASRWTEPGDEGLSDPPELAWPGPALPGKALLDGLELGCVTVSGDQAAEVLAAATSATSITPWVAGDVRWNLGFRPLLPDETGCEDLDPAR